MEKTKKIKVLLANEDEIFREGLAKVISDTANIEVVTMCSTGFESIERAIEFRPDIVILDDEISECGCIEVSQRIRKLLPETRIIILTNAHKEPDLSSMLRSEARGYITKDIKVVVFPRIIENVYKGGQAYPP